MKTVHELLARLADALSDELLTSICSNVHGKSGDDPGDGGPGGGSTPKTPSPLPVMD